MAWNLAKAIRQLRRWWDRVTTPPAPPPVTPPVEPAPLPSTPWTREIEPPAIPTPEPWPDEDLETVDHPRPWPALGRPIMANFCGHRTPWGEVCFDIFLAVWDYAQRKAVYALKRAMGITHIVLAAKGDYRGQNAFDFTRNPEGLLALIREVLDEGFTPIVFLSSGDAGTGGNPDAYFGPLLDALRSVQPHCIWVPGWEVVGPGGHWTSRELHRAVEIMAAHLVPSADVGIHLTDNRLSGSSHPGEPDDPCRRWTWFESDGEHQSLEMGDAADTCEARKAHPEGFWAGDEIAFWRTGLMPRAGILLWQSESGWVLLNADSCPVGYNGERGYRMNLKEALDRLPIGGHGWPRKRLCWFEGPAEDYYHGNCTDADVVRLANEGRALGVTEFGNGLPS